jgi:hypothetical protein
MNGDGPVTSETGAICQLYFGALIDSNSNFSTPLSFFIGDERVWDFWLIS